MAGTILYLIFCRIPLYSADSSLEELFSLLMESKVTHVSQYNCELILTGCYTDSLRLWQKPTLWCTSVAYNHNQHHGCQCDRGWWHSLGPQYLKAIAFTHYLYSQMGICSKTHNRHNIEGYNYCLLTCNVNYATHLLEEGNEIKDLQSMDKVC